MDLVCLRVYVFIIFKSVVNIGDRLPTVLILLRLLGTETCWNKENHSFSYYYR